MVGQHSRFKVGGWLAVIIVLLGILIPLGQIGSFLALRQAEPILEPRFGPNWSPYFTLTTAIMFIRSIICLFVARALIWDRRSSTPKAAIIGIWIALVLFGVASIAVATFFNPSPLNYSGAASNMTWKLLICIVVTMYLLRSKKVAAIYSVE